MGLIGVPSGMPSIRRPRVILVVVATAWGIALALAGLRAFAMAEAGSAGFGISPRMCTLAGWAFLASAQLVFSAMVADRYFPHASPVLTGLAEMATMVVMIGGAGGVGLLIAGVLA